MTVWNGILKLPYNLLGFIKKLLELQKNVSRLCLIPIFSMDLLSVKSSHPEGLDEETYYRLIYLYLGS